MHIAVPANKYPSIVLDMSTTVTARGRIRCAAMQDMDIPPGWALDRHGMPTTCAQEALEGSLEAIGGVKGFGLSLIIHIICGILTSTVMAGCVKNITDCTGPSQTGHSFMAVDITRFIQADSFKSRIDEVIQQVKSLHR